MRVQVRVSEELRFLLPSRHRGGDVVVSAGQESTIGHLVESVGIPRTEIGELLVNGESAPAKARPREGDVIDVAEIRRPRRGWEPRFLLDVHLGTLARRMRLLGIDTAYQNDASDPELVEQAITEARILLTQDRGILRRRALPMGGYVRGSDPDEQLSDVLDRYDPPLAPWTRCPTCNSPLEPVSKEEIEHLLEPGTRRSYSDFSRCRDHGHLYWRGAHAERLSAIISGAAGFA